MFEELVKRFDPGPLEGEMLRFYLERYEPDSVFRSIIEPMYHGVQVRVLILGEFGQGKTTFLNYWCSKLDKPFPIGLGASLVDLRLSCITTKIIYDDSPEKFFTQMLLAIYNGFKSKPNWIHAVSSYEPIEKLFRFLSNVRSRLDMVEKGSYPPWEQVYSWLQHINQESKIPIVVFIDSFIPGRGFESIEDEFDSLLQGGAINFVISMNTTVFLKAIRNHRKILSKFTTVSIPGYTLEEVKEVFRLRVSDFSKPENPFYPFEEEWIEEIWSATGVLRDAISIARRALLLALRERSLRYTHIARALEELEFMDLAPMVAELDELDRAILTVMARIARPTGPTEVAQKLQELGFNVSKVRVYRRIQELVRKGLVVPESEEKKRTRYMVISEKILKLLSRPQHHENLNDQNEQTN